MKTIASLALLPCFILPVACTQTVITHGDSSMRLNNFAGHTKAQKIRIGGESGILIDGWDDDATKVADAVVKEVGKAFRNYLLAEGIKYISGKYYDNKGAELNAKSTENLEKLRNARTAASEKHALEVLKATPVEEAGAASAAALVPAT